MNIVYNFKEKLQEEVSINNSSFFNKAIFCIKNLFKKKNNEKNNYQIFQLTQLNDGILIQYDNGIEQFVEEFSDEEKIPQNQLYGHPNQS